MGTGNPAASIVQTTRSWVYPRGHGESTSANANYATARGLSPWARGIPPVGCLRGACQRSIPVGTGNPLVARPRPWYRQVYPRGHGESSKRLPSWWSTEGLSPWARGIRRTWR